jgi:hypothetical protein
MFTGKITLTPRQCDAGCQAQLRDGAEFPVFRGRPTPEHGLIAETGAFADQAGSSAVQSKTNPVIPRPSTGSPSRIMAPTSPLPTPSRPIGSRANAFEPIGHGLFRGRDTSTGGPRRPRRVLHHWAALPTAGPWSGWLTPTKLIGPDALVHPLIASASNLQRRFATRSRIDACRRRPLRFRRIHTRQIHLPFGDPGEIAR